MIAGVVLGPSVLGAIWPEAQHWLFPWDPSQQTPDSQSYLYPVSQLGLALYMFIVGLEFRVEILRRSWRTSLSVSLAGMLCPFLFGSLLGYWLHGSSQMFSSQTTCFQAVLFIGAALCITAFPMLARIVNYHGLSGISMGTVALGAGAMDDACAWCLLAVVLASFDGTWQQALITIAGAVAFLLAATCLVRPLLQRIEQYFLREEQLTDTGLAAALAIMACCAWLTHAMGLHTVFGAFVAGAIIPRGPIQSQVSSRLQPLTVALLLPLFFVYSGIDTQIGLLSTAPAWGICLLVLYPGKRRRLLSRCLLGGITVARVPRCGHPHERARPYGINHHQYRLGTRHHKPLPVCDIGHHGGSHHAHGRPLVSRLGCTGHHFPGKHEPSNPGDAYGPETALMDRKKAPNLLGPSGASR